MFHLYHFYKPIKKYLVKMDKVQQYCLVVKSKNATSFRGKKRNGISLKKEPFSETLEWYLLIIHKKWYFFKEIVFL